VGAAVIPTGRRSREFCSSSTPGSHGRLGSNHHLIEASDRPSPVDQTEHGSGLGRFRWVVERTFAVTPVPPPPRPLRATRDIHEGFRAIGCCLICWRQLAYTAN
jgi:hypothetical protein